MRGGVLLKHMDLGAGGGGIQFQEEQYAPRRGAMSEPRGMAKLVIGWGLAKDEQGATRVLIGIAIGAIILAFAVPMLLGTSSGQIVKNFSQTDHMPGQQTP